MTELYVKSLSSGKRVWMEEKEDGKRNIKPKIEVKTEANDQENLQSDNTHQLPVPMNAANSRPLDSVPVDVPLANLPILPTSSTVSLVAVDGRATKDAGGSMSLAADKNKEKSVTNDSSEVAKWKESAQTKERESQLKEQLLESKDIVIAMMKEKYEDLEMKLKQKEEELEMMEKTGVGIATLESAIQTDSMENASETPPSEQLSRAARAAQLLGVPLVPMENNWKQKCKQLERTAESLRNDFNDEHLKYKTMKRRLRAERKTTATLRGELLEKGSKEAVEEPPIQLNVAELNEMVTSPHDPLHLEDIGEHQLAGLEYHQPATANQSGVTRLVNAGIGTSFPCTQCPNHLNFASAEFLEQHTRRWHNVRQCFPCDQCDRSFVNKSGLTEHMKRAHSGLKPFTCSFCQKSFSVKSVWKTHERAHTGERPYVCGVCQKAFVSSGHLRTHERLHTGEKRYCCQYCGRKFTGSGTCSKHQESCIQRIE